MMNYNFMFTTFYILLIRIMNNMTFAFHGNDRLNEKFFYILDILFTYLEHLYNAVMSSTLILLSIGYYRLI